MLEPKQDKPQTLGFAGVQLASSLVARIQKQGAAAKNFSLVETLRWL